MTPAELKAAFRRKLVALTPRPWFTVLFLGINVSVFALMTSRGVDPVTPSVRALLDWGGNAAPLTLGGDWWRLLTCAFLHAGLLHLLLNSIFLWEIGRTVERLLGNVEFLVVYLFSAIGAGMASVVAQSDRVSVGASGALLGILGALVGFLVRRPGALPAVFMKRLSATAAGAIVMTMCFSFVVPNVDVAAHVGGFVVGLGCGLVLSRPLAREAREVRARRIAVAGVGGTAVLVVAAAILAARGAPPAKAIPLDREKIAAECRSLVEAPLGVRVTSVDCPRRDVVKKGETFTCTVRAEDGLTLDVKVTMTDDRGNALLEPRFVFRSRVARSIEDQLRAETGRPVRVDCGTGALPPRRGLTFRCSVSVDGGQEQIVEGALTNETGQFSYRVLALPAPDASGP